MLDDLKKEKYCQARASGKSQRQAYLLAYPGSKRWKPETVDNKACRLEKENEVLARLRKLSHEMGEDARLTRKNLLEKLEGIINTKDVIFKGNEIIKAIEIYSDMCGYREVKTGDKQQKTAHEELMAAIREARKCE